MTEKRGWCRVYDSSFFFIHTPLLLPFPLPTLFLEFHWPFSLSHFLSHLLRVLQYPLSWPRISRYGTKGRRENVVAINKETQP